MPISLIVEESDQDLPGNPDNTVASLRDAVVNPDPQPTTVDPEPTPASEDNLPEKYKGKSVEEIVEMHRNLESLYGRMANDLGKQRQITDQLLDLKREEDLAKNQPTTVPEIDSADLLDNPTQVLDEYISAKTGETERQYLDRISALEASLAQQNFMSKHSDVNDITATEDFNTYLSRSPLRMELAQRAAQGDYVAADQLMTDYKDYASIARQADPDTSTTSDLDAARAASLEGGQNANSVQKQTTGKTYRRVDLIDLKMRKPEVYGDPAFQAEIVKAYQEGRVK